MKLEVNVRGNESQPFSTQLNNVNQHISIQHDPDRCLQALHCPNSLEVKNHIRQEKDKLLPESIEWIFHNPQYIEWQNRDTVGLLWIKGGAGKGKTMMSVGIVERLSQLPNSSTAVIYFFCQDANFELNTIQSIIKGLILQLINQQKDLLDSLRRRWDAEKDQYNNDMTSWLVLWHVFLEMLSLCQRTRIYIIVDALDECKADDDGMANLLKYVVRAGLAQPSKIKWLLTSRPLAVADQELLAGSDQTYVSMELNYPLIAQAVKRYIDHKVEELGQRQSYDDPLKRLLRAELELKAE